jgi:hypothetical protein
LELVDETAEILAVREVRDDLKPIAERDLEPAGDMVISDNDPGRNDGVVEVEDRLKMGLWYVGVGHRSLLVRGRGSGP